MNSFTRFLFPLSHHGEHYALILLLLRILFAALFMVHGIGKWSHFDELQYAYPDPLGVGSRFSLMLTIFAEVFCAGFVLLGLLTRPMLVPMIFAMVVALFVVHHGQPFAAKELSFIFLFFFVLLFITGPGRYSVDYFIALLMQRPSAPPEVSF